MLAFIASGPRMSCSPESKATRPKTCAIVSSVANIPATINHLFVYGTLRPGDVRWHHLAPFVVDEGWDDTAAGSLFDTGLDYPAAKFDKSGTIHGRTYGLLEASQRRCLELLDEVERVVEGKYSRVQITTGAGTTAWSYEYGAGLGLALIESGDWMNR
jgi:gamma-glutamylcyclotransferase (GGCT)/AIG2-like uncharacterized protein YtfP